MYWEVRSTSNFFLCKEKHGNLLLSNIVPNQEATQSVSHCNGILFIYVHAKRHIM